MRDMVISILSLILLTLIVIGILKIADDRLSQAQAEEVRVYDTKHQLQYVIRENKVYNDRNEVKYIFEHKIVERDPKTKPEHDVLIIVPEQFKNLHK